MCVQSVTLFVSRPAQWYRSVNGPQERMSDLTFANLRWYKPRTETNPLHCAVACASARRTLFVAQPPLGCSGQWVGGWLGR